MPERIKVGYHAGGLLHHDLSLVIEELASLGFAVIAVRPSAAVLDVRRADFSDRWESVLSVADRLGIELVIDLDADYVHGPHRRTNWSWICDDDSERDRAIEWMIRWCAAVRGRTPVRCVTIASGDLAGGRSAAVPNRDQESFSRTIDVVGQRITTALDRIGADVLGDVSLALRPSAGQAISTISHYATLMQWIGAEDRGQSRLGLAADVGEMIAAGEFPIGDRLIRCLSSLRCVYVCDRGQAGGGGVFEGGSVNDAENGLASNADVRIGHGEVATERIIQTLIRGGYVGPAVYRVMRHADDGFEPAREAIESFESL